MSMCAGYTIRRTMHRRSFLLALAAGATPVAGSSRVDPWPADKAAPPLELRDLDDRPWRLADQAGRVTVLNFWATWCEPCQAEMPALQTLARRHAASGQLQVIGVNYQEGALRVRRFVQRYDLRFPILLDEQGTAARAWTSRIFPTTVLVDARGRPRLSVVGEFDWASAEAGALVAPLLPRASGT